MKRRQALKIFIALAIPAFLFLVSYTLRRIRRAITAPFMSDENQHESRNG